jgi:hypothetical protein
MSHESLIVGFEYQTLKSGNCHELLHIVLADGTGVIEHHGNRADMPRLKTRTYPAGEWVPSQCVKTQGLFINPINGHSNIKMTVH